MSRVIPEQFIPEQLAPIEAPLGTVAHRIPVSFEGDGSGVEELSWGQREIWNAMCGQQSSLAIGGCLPLAAGTTIEYMVGELRFNMSRHQSMRTRLRITAEGEVRQVLFAAGEIAMEVFDVLDGDPADVAETIRARYIETDYDYVREWPMRMAVIRHGGNPTHVVAVIHHLVTDAFGAGAIMTDLAERDPVTGAARTPPPEMQPMAQARWQRGPAGQRQNAMAMRHWEGLLRTITPRRFIGSTDPRQPRYWEGKLDSPAMRPAVRVIAERTRSDSSAVLLAAFAVSLARLTGINPVVVQPVVSNRFRPGLAGVVSPINQTSLCVFDVADGTFDEVVERVRRRTLAAYKYAYYDPDQLAALVSTVERERGEELDIRCFYNDRRLTDRDDQSGPTPTPEMIRAESGRSTFQWLRQQDRPFERLFVNIEDVPDIISVLSYADTHHVSPDQIRACMEGMESIVVGAALDPAVRTGL